MEPSGSDEDRSLAMSKWMRRSDRDRVDFIDMCASPPTDGFFYANQTKINTRSTAVGCDQPRRNSGAQKSISVDVEDSSKIACKLPTEQGGFFKSYSSGTDSFNGMGDTSKVLNMDSAELEKWAKTNIRGGMEVQHPSDDTAPTPIDHVPQFQRIVPKITKTEESNRGGGSGSSSLRLVEKLTTYTPDITPCTTPSVTPAHSPMVPRKPGNPFFSGDPNPKQREEGSWLFRSNKNQTNMLYEAKLEIQQTTGPGQSQQGSKTVRYVPKPSQLRELNFFSPTSM